MTWMRAVWVLALAGSGCGPTSSTLDATTGEGGGTESHTSSSAESSTTSTTSTTSTGTTGGDPPEPECDEDADCPGNALCAEDSRCHAICRATVDRETGPATPVLPYIDVGPGCECQRTSDCPLDSVCYSSPCGCGLAPTCMIDEDCVWGSDRPRCLDGRCSGIACSDETPCEADSLCYLGLCRPLRDPVPCEDSEGHTRETSVDVAPLAAHVAATRLDDVATIALVGGGGEISAWVVREQDADLAAERSDDLAVDDVLDLAAAPAEPTFAIATRHGVDLRTADPDGVLESETHLVSDCTPFQVRLARIDADDVADVMIGTHCPEGDRIEIHFRPRTTAAVVTEYPGPAGRAGRMHGTDRCGATWFEFFDGAPTQRMLVQWDGAAWILGDLGADFAGYAETDDLLLLWYGILPSGAFVIGGRRGEPTHAYRTGSAPVRLEDAAHPLVLTAAGTVERYAWEATGAQACREVSSFERPVDDLAIAGPDDDALAFVLVGGTLSIWGP